MNKQNILDELNQLIDELIEECAVIAEKHEPDRFRGGYANGLIEGNPMWDIACEIRKLKRGV